MNVFICQFACKRVGQCVCVCTHTSERDREEEKQKGMKNSQARVKKPETNTVSGFYACG